MPDVTIAEEAANGEADAGEADAGEAAEGPPFKIKAFLVSGKEADLTLKAEASMADLREAIESSLGISAELQRLFVDAEEVLESYEVPLKDTFTGPEPLVVSVVAGEVLEEFILEHGWSQRLPARLRKEKTTLKMTATSCYRFRCRSTGKKVLVTFHEFLLKHAPDFSHVPTVAKDIFLMKQLNHPNLVKLLDVPPISTPHFCMITEWMDTNLARIIQSKQELVEDHCRYFTYQILEALCYLHSANVIYFHLTSWKVLLKANCDLKLKDLEDVRQMGMTGGAGFLLDRPSYRAPETFLSLPEDEEPIFGACDLWSTGCLLYEMYMRKGLFASSTALNQLKLMCNMLGRPDEASWFRGRSRELLENQLPTVEPKKTVCWSEWCGAKASEEGCQLMQQMMLWNPGSRCEAKEALKHSYFDDIRDSEDVKVDFCSKPVDWNQLSDLQKSHESCMNFLLEESLLRRPSYQLDG